MSVVTLAEKLLYLIFCNVFMDDDVQSKYLFRDVEESKRLLWDARDGSIDFFAQLMAYKDAGRGYESVSEIGLRRHLRSFYMQVKYYLDDFKDKLNTKEEDNISRFAAVVSAEMDELDYKDYEFAVDFIVKFFKVSGLTDITMEEKDLSRSLEYNR